MAWGVLWTQPCSAFSLPSGPRSSLSPSPRVASPVGPRLAPVRAGVRRAPRRSSWPPTRRARVVAWSGSIRRRAVVDICVVPVPAHHRRTVGRVGCSSTARRYRTRSASGRTSPRKRTAGCLVRSSGRALRVSSSRSSGRSSCPSRARQRRSHDGASTLRRHWRALSRDSSAPTTDQPRSTSARCLRRAVASGVRRVPSACRASSARTRVWCVVARLCSSTT